MIGGCLVDESASLGWLCCLFSVCVAMAREINIYIGGRRVRLARLGTQLDFEARLMYFVSVVDGTWLLARRLQKRRH